MIKSLLLPAALVAAAGAASAQTVPAPSGDHSAHADHAPAAARPTIDSSIDALVSDPATKTVMDKHLPGLADHPAYGQFKGMTLRQVAPYSQGHITDAVIAAIDAELKALPAD